MTTDCDEFKAFLTVITYVKWSHMFMLNFAVPPSFGWVSTTSYLRSQKKYSAICLYEITHFQLLRHARGFLCHLSVVLTCPGKMQFLLHDANKVQYQKYIG